jgi:hypothetical protein
MQIHQFLTTESQQKMKLVEKFSLKNPPKIRTVHQLVDLLQAFRTAIQREINLKPRPPMTLNAIRKFFIDFDKEINNITKSKFQSDILKMTKQFNFILQIGTDKIRINILVDSNNNNQNLISVLIHAINSFCYLFKSSKLSYNKLVINICLDSNRRTLEKDFDQMKKNSTALNASGVTYRKSQFIILTKQEEMLKLLFHELVHYAGLDQELVGMGYQIPWDIYGQSLNLSEAYAEFMALVLNSMYGAIQLSTKLKKDAYEIFDLIFKYEANYSLLLIATILKFYGFNHKTYRTFFRPVNKQLQLQCPIQIWEYIFARTLLLFSTDQMIDFSNWRLNQRTGQLVRQIVSNDNDLISNLDQHMSSSISLNNISYTCIEIDWNKL